MVEPRPRSLHLRVARGGAESPSVVVFARFTTLEHRQTAATAAIVI